MVIPAIIEFLACLWCLDGVKVNLRRADKKKGLLYARIYAVTALVSFIAGIAILVVMWTSFHKVF